MLSLRNRSLAALAVLVSLWLGTSALAQTISEAVGDRVVRYFASEDARASTPPSFCFVDPNLPATGPAPEHVPVLPEFFTDDSGRNGFHIDINPGTSLYGTGEVPGPLQRNGRTSILWNSDSYGYKDTTPSLYKSFPWVLAVREDGTAFGVIADTTWKTKIDLTDGISFISDGPAFPVVVIDRDTPQEVVMELAELTGKIAMPPKWAIGYHQCRYSYYPDARVREIADTFRAKKMPADVIWMDIHYMDEYRIFRFDHDLFPDPKGLNDYLLNERNFHNVWMIDPGVGAETDRFPPEGYSVYEELMAGDHAVKRADGSVYKGEVWPGWCVFPDFTAPDTRDWWAGLYGDFMANGITGVWNDMNEPAIFNVASKTMPEDNIHRGDPAMGGGGPHARFHNVYGMLMVKGTRAGVLEANPDKRPFVLSRATYLGGQRYGAGWSGDNSADWWDLETCIPMVLNMNLSAFPFYGPDIGGFIGDGDPEQFARWFGFGVMFPFARGHTAVGNRDKEPWAFGPEVEITCRQALENRYMLLPYYYTLFHDASTTGMPIVQPAFFADPTDPALRTEDDIFMIGSSLLVVPDVTPNRDRVPAMPRGIWRRLALRGSNNPDIPDFLVRGGSIIPAGPIMQYADEKPLDPLTLIVSLDDTGHASGTLYEDAGEGFGYQNGEFLLTAYTAEQSGDAVVVRTASQTGDLPRPDRAVVVRLLLDDGQEVRATGRDGEDIVVALP
ncbi:MAG TPA: DUF5110 domain-containing protein [Phycisphaerales bacterium]|nr:DUF5110 domain-containing protein [Phycisphaerales bacterium]